MTEEFVEVLVVRVRCAPPDDPGMLVDALYAGAPVVLPVGWHDGWMLQGELADRAGEPLVAQVPAWSVCTGELA